MSGLNRSAGALLLGVSSVALLTGLATSGASAQGTTYLDPITVVASRTEERVIQALAGVSAVRGEQLDQRMSMRVSDALWGVPGVAFQQRHDDPATSINIRGMQDFGRVAVVIDGARQNFQRTGHAADGLFYLEPEMLAGVDIVRGPVANIYGSGAIGGVASFRTKDTNDILRPGERYGALMHGELGSNQVQALGSTFAAARPTENVDLVVGQTARTRTDYRDGNGNLVPNSHFITYSSIGRLNVRPAEGHEVKFHGLTYESTFTNGLPPPPASASVFDARATNHIANGRWRYSRPDDRLFDFDGNVYWTQTAVRQIKIQGTPSVSTGPLGAERSFAIETTGTDVHNTSRFAWGDFRTAVTIGGDAFRDRVNVVDPTGTGDLFTPNGERTVSGTFAQFKTNYSTWLEVITAVRYDNYHLQGGNGATSGGDRVSPKVTVGVTPNPIPWFTVYGTYAEGYRAPAITEVFVLGTHPVMFAMFEFMQNTSLRPEVGKTKEVGINIRQDALFVPGDALRFKANVFRNDLTDFIEQTNVLTGQVGQGGQVCNNPIPPAGAGFCIQYQNIPTARIEGFEFEGTYDRGDWFASVAGTKLRGVNLTANQPLVKIPPPQLATTVGARFFERKAAFAVRWLAVDAKRIEDIPVAARTANPPTDAFNLIHLYASYAPQEDVLLALGIDNVFNVQYARYLDNTTRGSTVVPSPGPGMTFKGSLKVRFGNAFFRSG